MIVVPGDVIRVICKQADVNGSLIENVFFWRHDGSGAIADTAFLSSIENKCSAIYNQVSAEIPTTCNPYEIECDLVEFVSGRLTTIGPVGTIAWTTWAGGTSSTDGLPQGCACVINFPTASAGVQGRKYVGPLTEGGQGSGNFGAPTLAAMANFANEFLTALTITTETFTPVLMSNKFATAVEIVGAVVRAVVGYQRRRKAGRGI